METPDIRTRILIVDDHPIVRRGLAQMLNSEPDFKVCGEAGNSRKAITAVETLKPDMAIIDVALPGIDGIELIRDILSRWPRLPILVLSVHDHADFATRALEAGAKGYMMKEEATDKLIGALRRILDGHPYISENLTG